MSTAPDPQAQAPPAPHPLQPRPRAKPRTACLWAALALLLVLAVPACSLFSYVSLSGQPVSLGGDALLVKAERVPLPPSAPFLDTSSGSDDHRHCSGGRCTATDCDYTELFISSLKLTFTRCITTTTP